MRLKVPFAALVLMASVWAVQSTDANFGDAQGFSGRSGATCIACHTAAPPPMSPPATATLGGLPAGWDPGATYDLAIAVTGGPQAMPAPQPQGGFNVASNAGTFTLVDPASTRLIGDTEVSYTAAGTLMRSWTVRWTAPDLTSEPQPVQFWLAVIAANGNHVIAAGLPDGGERFDSGANLTVVVPPSAAARAAWQAIPLLAPGANVTLEGGQAIVEGRHADANATALAWSLDFTMWETRDTAAAFRLVLPNGEGSHVLKLRSEGLGRQSPEVTLEFGDAGFFAPLTPKGAPGPAPVAVAILLLVSAMLRRNRP